MRTHLTSAMALLLVARLSLALPLNEPVVHTDDGPIQGRTSSGITRFHGVPFAAPPVGDLRLRYPQRPQPWNVTKRTTRMAPGCPQLDIIKGIHLGDEDCLYLSVYVPSQCTITNPCPVMQWIYGGAWIIGQNEEFGLYDGSKIAMTHGVVVVAGNYRLDSLGWLALEELQHENADGHTDAGSAPYGNYGLYDQRLALQWTQRNIARFGGRAHDVTIFGESAGGFSVCQQMAMPGSDGLFSRAIMESGDCDGPWLITDGADAKQFGDAYATAAGCPKTGDATARLACLRTLPLKDIQLPYISWLCPKWKVNATDDPWCRELHSRGALGRLPDLDEWPVPRPPFAPIAGFTATVDGSLTGLRSTPLDLIQRGKINRSPTGEKLQVVLGTNTDEFALFNIAVPLVIADAWVPDVRTINRVIEHLIRFHEGWNDTTARQIRNAYPSDACTRTLARRATASAVRVHACTHARMLYSPPLALSTGLAWCGWQIRRRPRASRRWAPTSASAAAHAPQRVRWRRRASTPTSTSTTIRSASSASSGRPLSSASWTTSFSAASSMRPSYHSSSPTHSRS